MCDHFMKISILFLHAFRKSWLCWLQFCTGRYEIQVCIYEKKDFYFWEISKLWINYKNKLFAYYNKSRGDCIASEESFDFETVALKTTVKSIGEETHCFSFNSKVNIRFFNKYISFYIDFILPMVFNIIYIYYKTYRNLYCLMFSYIVFTTTK